MNGATSQRVPVLSGVLQGSVLGLLLFPICMDDLASLTFSSGSRLTLYADDILLYKPITIQADYESLQNHGLTPTMCHSTHQSVSVVHISRKRSPTIPLDLGITDLEIVKMFIKYLGRSSRSISSDLLQFDSIILCSKTRKIIGSILPSCK